jgi:hypothetical protein
MENTSNTPTPKPELSDEDLLDLVQRQTFAFFWEGAHAVSSMAFDRVPVENGELKDVVATGGTGFGIMSVIVAAERRWISRRQALQRIVNICSFLFHAENYHGVYPHFIDGATGAALTLWPEDAGSDIVETSFLMTGLLCARQYFDGNDAEETELRERINTLWRRVEWDWHVRPGSDVLQWHRTPDDKWGVSLEIRGWNECLITYVLSASSPDYAIDAAVYHRGWAAGGCFNNGTEYYGVRLPLGSAFGGPLFFTQYAFLGIDPRGLKDSYANYWDQNMAHSLINYEHCVRNPHGYKGYGPDCWGLSASDGDNGYCAHAPDNDHGVITPTAAIANMPYTPEQSMRALRRFYYDLGDSLWRAYGFIDAFNETTGWRASYYLAISQGPIIIMIENFRTGLLWRLFMSCPEVQGGLKKLGFESEKPTA